MQPAPPQAAPSTTDLPDVGAQSPAPSPDQISRITRDLINPRLSFIDVADRNNITVDDLTLLLARPDVEEHLQRLDNSLAARARRIATHSLPAVALALDRIVAEFNADAGPPDPVNNKNNTGNNDRAGTSTTSIPDPEHRRRAAETVRRSGNLLLRIARFHGAPPPPAPRRHHPGADTASRAKTQGFRSLGPAPTATRAPTPTPDDIDDPSASPAPPRQAPCENRDRALIQELAFNRRVAARILDEILPRPPASPARRPREPEAAPTNNTAPSQQPQNTPTEPKARAQPPTRSPSNPPASSPTLPLPSGLPRDFPTPPLLSRIPDPLSTLPLDPLSPLPLLSDRHTTLVFLPLTPHTPPLFPITSGSRASRLAAAAGTTTPGPAP